MELVQLHHTRKQIHHIRHEDLQRKKICMKSVPRSQWRSKISTDSKLLKTSPRTVRLRRDFSMHSLWRRVLGVSAQSNVRARSGEQNHRGRRKYLRCKSRGSVGCFRFADKQDMTQKRQQRAVTDVHLDGRAAGSFCHHKMSCLVSHDSEAIPTESWTSDQTFTLVTSPVIRHSPWSLHQWSDIHPVHHQWSDIHPVHFTSDQTFTLFTSPVIRYSPCSLHQWSDTHSGHLTSRKTPFFLCLTVKASLIEKDFRTSRASRIKKTSTYIRFLWRPSMSFAVREYYSKRKYTSLIISCLTDRLSESYCFHLAVMTLWIVFPFSEMRSSSVLLWVQQWNSVVRTRKNLRKTN